MLKAASDGKEYALRDMRQLLAEEFALTEEERTALLPSGRQPIFANRVAWSKVYLCQAGLLTSPRRGFLKISPRGIEVTGSFSPEAIDYVTRIDPKIVLIAGRHLAEIMIDFNIGVTALASYQLKRIDTDYFGDE